MAMKIDGKWFVTTAEAGIIMKSKRTLMAYWIYQGHFAGIISMDEPEVLISEDPRITVDMAEKMRSNKKAKKKNFFLIPLDSVLEKMEKLRTKKAKSRLSKKIASPVQEKEAISNE